MTLFRFPEDRLPVFLFACYFALDLAVLALAVPRAVRPIGRNSKEPCGLFRWGL